MMGLLMISNMAEAASCAGGAGITVTGVDGVTYCESRIRMNWWSAFAWCEGANMTLVSLDDCIVADGSGTTPCPNFDHTGSGSVWTSSVPNSTEAYRIELSTGILNNNSNSNGTRISNNYALCK